MTNAPTPIQPAPPFIDDCPSLDEVHAQVEWALDRAHDQINGIDAKCGVVLTSASLLLAGMAALQVAVGSHVAALPHNALTPWWEIAARAIAIGVAITFLAVVGFSVVAMWPRTFRIAPTPTRLRKRYLGKDPRETKVVILNERAGSYKSTQKKINEKVGYMKGAFIALAVEGVLLVVVLLIASFAL